MSQGTPEHQVVALLQRGDLRGAHQLLLSLQQQRPDDAALRARTQQVEALIQQRLQSGLPVGPSAAPAPAPAQSGYAPAEQPYDAQTLAALQAQVLAEPVRYAYAYLQAGRLGESLQLLRIALGREPGNMQVRDLALYVARQIQQQQAQAAAPPPQYGAFPQPQYGAPAQPQYAPPAQPQYAPPAQPQYAPPAQPQYSPPAPKGPSAAPAGAGARFPQDAITHRTGEMPAFLVDDNPALAAAAALPPRSQVPSQVPRTPPQAPPPAPAPRYPLDARASESMEMSLDELAMPPRPSYSPEPPRASVPPSAPGSFPPPGPASVPPSAPGSFPPLAHGSMPPPARSSVSALSGYAPSISVPADEPRPDPNEVVRTAREIVKAAALSELQQARVSAPSAPAAAKGPELAIDIDEPFEAVPVDFDEAPEPDDEPAPELGEWPGPQWVDRSLPSAPNPLLRAGRSEPTPPPLVSRSAPPPASPRSAPPALRSAPPPAHRWDADSSSPEQDAFSIEDEPMEAWSAPAAASPPPEDPLVREARERADRMQAAFDRYSRRDSVPTAPPAKSALEPVNYSEGLGADLLSADAAATELASASELPVFDDAVPAEDEPLELGDDEVAYDEVYEFEPASVPPAAAAASRENPPYEPQMALADPGPGFVSAPRSAPMSEEAVMLDALLGQIRARRRSPSRHLPSL